MAKILNKTAKKLGLTERRAELKRVDFTWYWKNESIPTVIAEHENGWGGIFDEEVPKLLASNAGLKVLVCYPPVEKHYEVADELCGGHRESCSTEPELSASEGIRSSLTLLTKSGRATTCKLLAWRRSTLAESFNANSENRSGRRKLRSLSLHIEQVVLRTPTGFIAGEERKTNRGRPRIPSRDKFQPYSCPCLSQQRRR